MDNFTQNFTALSDTGMMATTLYLSVMTAYFVVAYSVGAKLERSQLIIISVLIATFAFIFAVSTWALFNSAIDLNVSRTQYEGWMTSFPEVILFIELAGIVAGLKFMLDIRKRHKESGLSDNDT